MARKRMLSPSIWVSESFGELSTLGKLVFIGFISLADDEGRGLSSSKFVKGQLFPYDEKLRATDIENAILEVCQKMSIVRYTDNGKQLYQLTNWLEYQTIQKPTPSKYPSPALCGEGEVIASEEEKAKNYSSGTVGVQEEYSPREEEKKGIEDNIKEEEREVFVVVLKDIILDEPFKHSLEEYKKIMEELSKSEWATENFKHLSKIHTFWKRIITGFYKTNKKERASSFKSTLTAGENQANKSYTGDELNAMFGNLKYEDI